MSRLSIQLSNAPAAAHWGKNAVLSFDNESATIHLLSEDPQHRTIRRAARILDGLNLDFVTLCGKWQIEQVGDFLARPVIAYSRFSGNQRVHGSAMAKNLAQVKQARGTARSNKKTDSNPARRQIGEEIRPNVKSSNNQVHFRVNLWLIR